MWFFVADAADSQLVTFHPPGHGDWVVIAWTWIVMAIIVAFALLARAGFNVVPGGLAGMFEHTFHWIDDLAHGMMGAAGRAYVPLAMTIFMFVLVSNWLGLCPGFGAIRANPSKPAGIHFTTRDNPEKGESSPNAAKHEALTKEEEPFGLFEAPTSNLNTTLALALVSFLSFTLFGMHKHYQHVQGGEHAHGDHGHGDSSAHAETPQRDPISSVLYGFVSWLGHFIQPTPMLWNSMEGWMRYLLVPMMCVLFILLNIIEELARVISLTLRLFGNIAGEHQVKAGLLAVMFLFGTIAIASLQSSLFAAGASGLLTVLLWGISVFVTLIGALAGFVQAMVFMLLTLSYISHAVVLEH